MMRIAPRTPKAGSSLVSRTMGGGVVDVDGEEEVVVVVVGVEEVEVEEAMVKVTLYVVGTTVVNRTPGRGVVVMVAEAVVREKEKEGERDDEEELED